jgi:hypothetical protein
MDHLLRRVALRQLVGCAIVADRQSLLFAQAVRQQRQ